jgi:glucan biosynthesis protein C
VANLLVNTPAGPKPSRPRSCALDYLRATITVLVVFLHAILAYPTWGTLNPTDYVHSTAPVIDPLTSRAFDLLPALLNNFFMALMFFISGLFVWKSLAKKGAAAFLMDRWRRLGIPFLLSLAVIMPLAYYPAFLLTGAEEDALSYWVGWSWNSGPAWFLSMLFGFDLLLAIGFQVTGHTHRAVPRVLVTRPRAFFLALVVISGLGLMPLMAVYGPLRWLEWGPIIIGQACRPVLYAVYFVAGVAVGARGLESTFLTPDGPLAQRWRVWLIASIGAALALVVALSGVRLDPTVPWTRPAGWWQLGCCMVLYSATLSMAFLALFLRFMHARYSWADNLSDNAYGIYVVHYPFVVWTQYLLLDSSMPATLKALIVFSVSLGLSWATSAIVRSIPGVRAVL